MAVTGSVTQPDDCYGGDETGRPPTVHPLRRQTTTGDGNGAMVTMLHQYHRRRTTTRLLILAILRLHGKAH